MSKARIGPIDFEIVFVERLTDNDRHTKLSGCISYDRCVIEIERQLADQTKNLVFWHEAFHAILTQYGINPEEEERLVDALANGIVDFLHDNPNFELEAHDE